MDKKDNLLLEEYRYVRTKQQVRTPDVKKAWQQFEHEHIMDRKAKARHRIMFYRYAAAIAILLVLTMGAIGLWWTQGGEQVMETYNTRKYIHQVMEKGDGLLTTFESTRAPQKILMGCSGKPLKPIEHSISCNEASVDTAKAVFYAQNILDIAEKTIVTPRGKTYKVVLSDGSLVVLNADSKLVFPVHFNGKSERKVKLVGEAFFQVTKDAEHPFIVETPQVSTTVLGTEFDVKAYADGSSKVTLLSGSVKVCKTGATADKGGLVLTPGQEMLLSSDTQAMEVLNLGENAKRAIKWKNGTFSFHSTPLLEAIKDMGRWYNVDVEISDNSLKTETITLEISRRISLEDFVNSINITHNLSAVLENGKIVICPKSASQGIKLCSLYPPIQEDE